MEIQRRGSRGPWPQPAAHRVKAGLGEIIWKMGEAANEDSGKHGTEPLGQGCLQCTSAMRAPQSPDVTKGPQNWAGSLHGGEEPPGGQAFF